jgi:hypothetical protein
VCQRVGKKLFEVVTLNGLFGRAAKLGDSLQAIDPIWVPDGF